MRGNLSQIAINVSGHQGKEAELSSKNYWALLLLILCVSTVFGNVLVILSVVKERSLQNITNFFIVSLAVADLCVAGVVMPFYTYTLVSKKTLFAFCFLVLFVSF